jgi:hypothetical protein
MRSHASERRGPPRRRALRQARLHPVQAARVRVSALSGGAPALMPMSGTRTRMIQNRNLPVIRAGRVLSQLYNHCRSLSRAKCNLPMELNLPHS